MIGISEKTMPSMPGHLLFNLVNATMDLLNPTPAQIKYRNRKWAEALLTSKKGRQYLARPGKQCCLGVAQNVAREMGLDVTSALDNYCESHPDEKVVSFFGWESENPILSLPGRDPEEAAAINDGMSPFLPDKGLSHKKISECVMNTFVHPKKQRWTFRLP